MTFSVRLETPLGDRIQADCRSWREVRWLARTWRPYGHTLAMVHRKAGPRLDWKGARVASRAGLRALRGL